MAVNQGGLARRAPVPAPAAQRARPRRTANEPRDLVRFDVTERLVHWSLGAIVITLIVTGLFLYIPALALSIGHRALIENIHVYVGITLPAPLVVGLVGPWRKGLAADVKRLNRWAPGEAAWFHRARPGERRPRLGKFNPGQKLNAAVLAGALAAMLVTGVMMRWAPPSLITAQTGATLVHDGFFLVIGILVVGHILMALAHPSALRSMFGGRVSRAWARRHAPRWLEEVDPAEAARRRTRAGAR
jgi:formate dehydrogenase subunit gamma